MDAETPRRPGFEARRAAAVACWLVVAVPALVLAGSCAKKPGVSIEQLHEAESREPATDGVTPPWCAELPSAAYPSDLPQDERPERVDVRVDLTLDEFGRARHVRATALGEVADPEPFLRAARAATEALRCVPALRPPNPEAGRKKAVTIAYRTALMFRFHRDGREVRVGMESP